MAKCKACGADSVESFNKIMTALGAELTVVAK